MIVSNVGDRLLGIISKRITGVKAGIFGLIIMWLSSQILRLGI